MYNVLLRDLRYRSISHKLQGLNIKKVIDIGCAEGGFECFVNIYNQNINIIGLDKSQKACNLAKRNIESINGTNVTIICIDAISYLENNDVENVICLETIEHMNQVQFDAFEDKLFSNRIKNIFITTPNRDSNSDYKKLWNGLRSRDHKFEFTFKQAEEWCNKIHRKYLYKYTIEKIHGIHIRGSSLLISFRKSTDDITIDNRTCQLVLE